MTLPMGAVLCYVRGAWAFFTTLPLKDQRGDDWNDAPYEHNAGEPYHPCWHNHPESLYSPHRGKIEPGELCRCPSCLQDWNDDGTPKWQLVQVAWDAPLETPSDGVTNSHYSVDQINAGEVAWLRPCRWANKEPRVVIHGGTTLQRFIELIHECGGKVYLPVERP